MSDYVKQLEEQNAQLQERLARCEKKLELHKLIWLPWRSTGIEGRHHMSLTSRTHNMDYARIISPENNYETSNSFLLRYFVGGMGDTNYKISIGWNKSHPTFEAFKNDVYDAVQILLYSKEIIKI